MNIEVLVRQAQARGGTEAQLNMTVEECAELIYAIQKHRRHRTDWAKVIEEGVDVELMIEQLKVITDAPALWRDIRERKLARLQRILEGMPVVRDDNG